MVVSTVLGSRPHVSARIWRKSITASPKTRQWAEALFPSPPLTEHSSPHFATSPHPTFTPHINSYHLYMLPNSLFYICGFFRPIVAFFLPLYIIIIKRLHSAQVIVNVSQDSTETFDFIYTLFIHSAFCVQSCPLARNAIGGGMLQKKEKRPEPIPLNV